MSANGSFKKSLFGFKKSSVLDYIEQYQLQFKSQAEESEAKIKALTEQLTHLEDEYQKAVQINQALEQKVMDCETAIADLSAAAASMQEEILRKRDLHEKIGNIYVEAKADAKQILQTASDDARSLLDSADRSANFTAEQIQDTVENLTGIRSDLESSVRSFDDRIQQINRTLNEVRSRLKRCRTDSTVTDDDLDALGILPRSEK